MGIGLTPASEDGFVEHGAAFSTVLQVSATLSIVGCLIVIGTFLAYPQLRRFFARLVVYLAVSDLWLCTSLLMGQSRAPHYTKCMIQSSFGTFFGLSSVMWTVAIADSIRRVLLVRDLSVESKYEARLHMVAWGLPTLAVLGTLSSGVSGPAGLTCWIRNTAGGTVVRMLTFYVPLWFGIGYCVWVYRQVQERMGQLLRQHQVNGISEYESNIWDYEKDLDRQRWSLKCLLLLPMILIFCWTPSSIRRVIDVFVPGWTWTPLDYFCVFASPLQGVLNALVYGATPAVRDVVFGRLDQSARKLRNVQSRLRSLRSLRPGRRRRRRQKFERLGSADVSTPGRVSLEDDAPLEDSASPGGGGPEPEAVGRPYHLEFASPNDSDDRGAARGDEEKAGSCNSSPRGSEDVEMPRRLQLGDGSENEIPPSPPAAQIRSTSLLDQSD